MALLHLDPSLAPHNLGRGMTATARPAIFYAVVTRQTVLNERAGQFNKKRMQQWCLAGFPAVQI
jgi:hypothetical protein